MGIGLRPTRGQPVGGQSPPTGSLPLPTAVFCDSVFLSSLRMNLRALRGVREAQEGAAPPVNPNGAWKSPQRP